jgi:hypothetical protein
VHGNLAVDLDERQHSRDERGTRRGDDREPGPAAVALGGDTPLTVQDRREHGAVDELHVAEVDDDALPASIVASIRASRRLCVERSCSPCKMSTSTPGACTTSSVPSISAPSGMVCLAPGGTDGTSRQVWE